MPTQHTLIMISKMTHDVAVKAISPGVPPFPRQFKFRNRCLNFVVLSFVVLGWLSSLAAEDTTTDEQRRSTAVALNYSRASLHRIRKNPSIRVLLEEQEKILNHLDLNGIADEEVLKLYSSVLDEISNISWRIVSESFCENATPAHFSGTSGSIRSRLPLKSQLRNMSRPCERAPTAGGITGTSPQRTSWISGKLIRSG